MIEDKNCAVIYVYFLSHVSVGRCMDPKSRRVLAIPRKLEKDLLVFIITF